MKALAIQPARGSQRATLPALMAAVSNLRSRIDERATMATAIASCVVFFVCLGLMHVPGIVISGLITLTCAMSAPMGDDDAPIDKDIEQEGGAL